MLSIFVGILHTGPAVEPTLSEYLARVLIYLGVFGGLALLVRGAIVMADATRSAFNSGDRADPTDR